jgi:glutamine kinase
VSKSSFFSGTKGSTLEQLKDRLTHASVLPIQLFTVEQWRKQRDQILRTICEMPWGKGTLIVRSSALSEDTLTQSGAGEFLSVAGVVGAESLAQAIDRVIASYVAAQAVDQVLVQPQLTDVSLSGVAFSLDPNLLSPYRVINYEKGTGDTSAVTSGGATRLHTVYCLQGEESRLPEELLPIARCLDELEKITGNRALDIEFAISDGRLHLFQCRPLVLPADWQERCATLPELREALNTSGRKIEQLSKPHPYLLGKTTLFGVMPDWNPAEIIGLKPRPLALTLYRELITSGIWAYQRDNYGYRNLRSFPLLVDFWGLPYIDVRVSFNSFVPKSVSEELGAKLVDFYLAALAESPTLHDKVEFEIALTCYTLDFDKRLRAARAAGFTDAECEELRTALRALTDQIIHHDTGLWRKDIEKIRKLEKRIATIMASDLDEISRVYWLLEDCKRYGTLPFAGLARAGFIAVQMLRSLVTEGIFTQQDYDRFFESLETVSFRMVRDFQNMSRPDFLSTYGHLRPGTYDVLSQRYDQAPERYFDWEQRTATKPQVPFVLELEKLKRLESALAAHGMPYSPLDFLDFIRAAIEGREYSKFVFTRSLSEAMEGVVRLAETHGFSRDDASYLDIAAVMGLYASADCTKTKLGNAIAAGRARYEVTRKLRLPPLITQSDAIYCFELPSSAPNFVTQKRVSGSVIRLDGNTRELGNGIVFIPSADPGYDWIFSKNISGLVTMFGGANSHMAIRAGELGIAAVIGVGEKFYSSWSDSEVLELDCQNQKVQPLR